MADRVPKIENLTQSLDWLANQLNTPPRRADGSIDLDLLRMDVKQVLAYHDTHPVHQGWRGALLTAWLQTRWESYYTDPRYSYRSADGRTRNVLFDLDDDGVPDGVTAAERAAGKAHDDFPMRPAYQRDTDGDGVPDPIDLFPHDSDRFLHPGDAPYVRFDHRGRPTLVTTLTLYRQPTRFAEAKFLATVRRWQASAPQWIAQNRRDHTFDWAIRLVPAAPTEQRTIDQYDVTDQVLVTGFAPPEFAPRHTAATSGWWPCTISTNMTIHEAGHHIGLEDRYFKPTDTIRIHLQKKFLVRPNDLMSVAPGKATIYADDIKIAMAEATGWTKRLDLIQASLHQLPAVAEQRPEELAEAIRAILDNCRIVRALNPAHPRIAALIHELVEVLTRIGAPDIFLATARRFVSNPLHDAEYRRPRPGNEAHLPRSRWGTKY